MTLDLSENIKSLVPKDSGVIVNKLDDSGLYEILFPVPGIDPQSFICTNFPNSAPYSGVSSRDINGRQYIRHSFVLYEMPKIHRPSNYEIYGAVWLSKTANRQEKIGELYLKTTPFEIIESAIAKLFLSTNSKAEQRRRLINLTGKSDFEELSAFFVSETERLKLDSWRKIKDHLRVLGVEPSEQESDKWF